VVSVLSKCAATFISADVELDELSPPQLGCVVFCVDVLILRSAIERRRAIVIVSIFDLPIAGYCAAIEVYGRHGIRRAGRRRSNASARIRRTRRSDHRKADRG
jgi:hypothetical protein